MHPNLHSSKVLKLRFRPSDTDWRSSCCRLMLSPVPSALTQGCERCQSGQRSGKVNVMKGVGREKQEQKNIESALSLCFSSTSFPNQSLMDQVAQKDVASCTVRSEEAYLRTRRRKSSYSFLGDRIPVHMLPLEIKKSWSLQASALVMLTAQRGRGKAWEVKRRVREKGREESTRENVPTELRLLSSTHPALTLTSTQGWATTRCWRRGFKLTSVWASSFS